MVAARTARPIRHTARLFIYLGAFQPEKHRNELGSLGTGAPSLLTNEDARTVDGHWSKGGSQADYICVLQHSKTCSRRRSTLRVNGESCSIQHNLILHDTTEVHSVHSVIAKRKIDVCFHTQGVA